MGYRYLFSHDANLGSDREAQAEGSLQYHQHSSSLNFYLKLRGVLGGELDLLNLSKLEIFF